mmetsp:Transcript_35239/g.80451  ORF Transcript_35239/g.80451 Transcript_35239/m.80451 type:complete len:215 (-) Transcript_35239:181-825(-)
MGEPLKEELHFRLTMVTLGDKGVGKTSMLNFLKPKLVHDVTNTVPSTGVDVFERLFERKGMSYGVEFWDVPGEERFRISAGCYCAAAAGCALVFDVSRRLTFHHIEDWMKAAELDERPKILIGTKSDCPKELREVSASRAESFAQKHKMKYFETSALRRSGINEAYQALFNDISKVVSAFPEPSHLGDRGIELCDRLCDDERLWLALFASNSGV